MKMRLANEKDPRVGYHAFRPAWTTYAPPPNKKIKDMTDTEAAYSEGLLAGCEMMVTKMDEHCRRCKRK